jgi:NADPH:quinone reductase-like Zn-dependent oxidoreductase
LYIIIHTEAWVLLAGESYPATPGELLLQPYAFDDIGANEVLAEPIYGCWEANMSHAVTRSPVDICRQRGETRVVLGNAGVVRILATGAEVQTVKQGDMCVLISVDVWDEYGYPVKIFAYDAPNTIGLLAKRIKLRGDQVVPIAHDSRRSLQQWAAFSVRYASAWDNWQVASAAWQLQMVKNQCAAPQVWGWGGGVALAELLLARSQGCRATMITSSDERIALCERLGLETVDRRQFPDLAFDHGRFQTDLAYRRRYMRSESAFLRTVKERTNGAGVSIFIDNIGGPVFRATQKALARQGVVTTCGWKEGTEVSMNRAAECIGRHIHVFTHGSRRSPEALHYAEQNSWLAPADDEVWSWDRIPELSANFSNGLITSYFPLFAVNTP